MLDKLSLVGVATLTALVMASACGGDSDVDFGEAGGTSGADAAAGSAGTATGGTGGVATGGAGGVSTGGSAGVATGGSAGVATGGSAGVATGGSAGVATGGSAGSGNLLPLGAACSDKAQCASGNCSDGVCCDTACGGGCEKCDADGACKQVGANTDPDDECGDCKVCDGAGACVAVPDGTDPIEECATQDPSSCGTTGTCHGGECALHDAFTICQKGTCSVSSLTAKLCDGKGNCGAVGTVSCSPYTCNETLDGCRTSCATSAHCVAGVQCDVATGICLANLPKGSNCSEDAQCASGYCTDGVCCDKSCSGFCEACDSAGSVGSCKPVATGTDPDNECGGQGPCNGSCDGGGGCAWPKGTSCTAQASCIAGYTSPAQCNGYGFCAPTQPCAGGLACASSSSCRTSCFYDQHCQKGYFCTSVGSCQKGTIALGAACQAEGSCESGDCGDAFSTFDCSSNDICVQCDDDSDCPSGRCDGCKCEDRLKSAQGCNENNDCLSGVCLGGTTCQ